MTATHTLDWTDQLVDQMDRHWTSQLRPRLEGMTDDEYHFSPAPDERTWDVRPRGTSRAPMQGGAGDHTIDFEFPEPAPAPLTTIAWRIGHLVVGVLGARWHSHFGGPPHDYMTHTYAGDAAGGLARLDLTYAAWMNGVRGLDAEALARLHQRIRPFFLRRTKDLVAADLPEKQESIVAVDMTAEQAALRATPTELMPATHDHEGLVGRNLLA